MKKATLCLTVGLALFAASRAAAEDAAVKETPRVEAKGEQAERLKSEFKVDDARVQGLRDRKLGYGEVSIVLGLAEKMPGGITDANVKTIMDMRAGPPAMGWGQIAKKQGTTLGQLKGAAHEGKGGRPEKAGKPEKAERPEKAARPEKAERPERASKPEHGKR